MKKRRLTFVTALSILMASIIRAVKMALGKAYNPPKFSTPALQHYNIKEE